MRIKRRLRGVKTGLVRRLLIASVTIGIALISAPDVQAGFKWTPLSSEQVAPFVMALPASDSVESESLDEPAAAEPMSFFPLPEKESFVKELEQESAPQDAIPTVYDEALGFGRDIPMALVMRQIVPADFSYSFDTGVNPGTRISWNGGKPWNEVLEEALEPLDMDIIISGNVVWVRPLQETPEETATATATATESESESEIKTPVVSFAEPLIEFPEPVSVVEHEHFASKPVPVIMANFDPVAKRKETVPEQSYPRHHPIPFIMKQDQEKRIKHSKNSRAPVSLSPPPIVLPLNESNYRPILPVQSPVLPAVPTPPVIEARPSFPPSFSPAAAASTVTMYEMSGRGAPFSKVSALMPVMDPFEIRFWHAERGVSLKNTLEAWSNMAGVALLWNSAYDYSLPMPVRMHGTFPDAVTHILMDYEISDPRPLGHLHPNLPDGPSVLLIENYSNATNYTN